MQARRLLPAAALVCVGVMSGCGSTGSHSAQSSSRLSGLGGRAPARLVGTYRTTFSRKDRAQAPKPGELPLGRWTLLITNTGGASNTRALAVGKGDADRVSHRFTVVGDRLSIGCNDGQGLPSTGSQTYTWSIGHDTLMLTATSPPCKHDDPNTQLILSGHPWTKQGAH